MVSKRSKETKPWYVKLFSRARAFLGTFDYVGIVVALVFFCFSVLPSLLPRPWFYQAIISGVSLAVGYGIGAALSAIVRWSVNGEINLPRIAVLWAWRIVVALGPVVMLGYLYIGLKWQDEVRKLVGETSLAHHYYFRTLFLLVVVAFALVLLARAVRRATRLLIRVLDKYLPRRASIVIGLFFVVIFGWWLFSGVFYNFFVTTANRVYASKNDETPSGATKPETANRSGSAESLVSWQSLGYQGRAFIGRGPTTKDISLYTGEPATDPIRVYVGLKSAPNAATRAELAVKELERTHAFDRKVLVLATATGTGWLEPQATDSIEYMYGGDTAIVTQQYSYLPSWISFLVDTQNARDAGRELFDAVYAAWAARPADARPKLIAYGLSLGSFGGQAAYSGVNDMQRSLDGALFVGTPNDTELWRGITDQRDAGSPEWQPVYKGGTAVQFAATNSDLSGQNTVWKTPRILYLQHASDPVVWFNFNLLFHEPDWLKEPRGTDVSTQTRWYPVVTFLQVAIDQFFGVSVPNGHGHNYPDTMVNAWAAVVPPEDWTTAKAAKLQTIIANYQNE